jgi:hypothetical protein
MSWPDFSDGQYCRAIGIHMAKTIQGHRKFKAEITLGGI